MINYICAELQVDSAVEMLSDLLGVLLDLLRLIPAIPDKYTAKPEQSDDFAVFSFPISRKIESIYLLL
jgi:hypothetical protein